MFAGGAAPVQLANGASLALLNVTEFRLGARFQSYKQVLV